MVWPCKQNALGKPFQTNLACQNRKKMGKDQIVDVKLDGPRNCGSWKDRLKFHPSKMIDVMEDGEVWPHNLELLLPQRSQKTGNEEKKEICAEINPDLALSGF